MKRFLLALILISYGCTSNSSDETNSKEFIQLFPNETPTTSFEIENGNSIVLYGFHGLNISMVSPSGEVLWTKQHELDIDNFNNSFFLNDNFIIAYTNNSNGEGLLKVKIDMNGEIQDTEVLSNKGDIITQTESNVYIFDINYKTSDIVEVTYKKFSVNGELISDVSFETEHLKYGAQDIIVKNNLIYVFDDSDFQGSPNYYENYYCKIFDLDGNLLNTINTETNNRKSSHSMLVLNNGNILMSIFNFQPEIPLESYSLRLFNQSGDLLISKDYKSYSINLKLALLSNDNIALAGGRDRANSQDKLSQFTVLDKNLNVIYSRNIGAYDDGDWFYKINESSSSYYLLGKTFGYDGDYDLPNRSTSIDMIYWKLKK